MKQSHNITKTQKMKNELFSFLFYIFCFLFSSFIYAEKIEVWECKDYSLDSNEILVRASVNEGRNTGTIEVAGITHNSIFSIAGFERRWDFPRPDFNYAFIIEPNGLGRYYDFSNKSSVKASILMYCKQ